MMTIRDYRAYRYAKGKEIMSEHDDWDFEPSLDNQPSWLETIEDTALFFGRIIVVLTLVAIFIGAIAYLIWREIAIAHFLMGV